MMREHISKSRYLVKAHEFDYKYHNKQDPVEHQRVLEQRLATLAAEGMLVITEERYSAFQCKELLMIAQPDALVMYFNPHKQMYYLFTLEVKQEDYKGAQRQNLAAYLILEKLIKKPTHKQSILRKFGLLNDSQVAMAGFHEIYTFNKSSRRYRVDNADIEDLLAERDRLRKARYQKFFK